MAGPLSGIRVLEFSVVVAAPLAGMHLADMGATVTKVEALEGDSFRYAHQVVPTAGGKLFTWFNRGKRGITLNLQDERAQRIVQHLVRDTDVVLVNYRPGVAERLGIDYPTLSEFRPDLIYADITGFGRHGPLAHRAGMDIVAQAFAGTTATFGRLDQKGNPSTTQVAISDVSTGIACVGAVLAALYHRERTGEGQLVELALVRSAMSFIGWILARDPISDPLLVAPIVGDMEEARAHGGGYREIIGARNQHEFRVAQGPYYGGFDARDGGFSMGASTPGNRARVRDAVRDRGRSQRRPRLRRARPGQHREAGGDRGPDPCAGQGEDGRGVGGAARQGRDPGLAHQLSGAPARPPTRQAVHGRRRAPAARGAAAGRTTVGDVENRPRGARPCAAAW